MGEERISPLRQRMIEDMRIRGMTAVGILRLGSGWSRSSSVLTVAPSLAGSPNGAAVICGCSWSRRHGSL